MIKGWLSSCLKLRSKMLLCGLQSFPVKCWDLCYLCYPGRKSICCMVHGGNKTPHFPTSSCLANVKYVWLRVLSLSLSPCKEPSGLMPLPHHVLLHSRGQHGSRKSSYPGGLPEPILTRRCTWKVSISLFIRFGIQLALSFEVSALLKTGVCLFMFFLWLEKFLAGFSEALGEILLKLLAR